MRHHNTNRKFGRETDQRRALMRTLAYSLIKHGHITTTEAKAKELRPYMEKLVTASRVDNREAIRLVQSKLPMKSAVNTLFKTIAPKYKDRKGGYTRIVKLQQRLSDGARMAMISFV
ncbi:MAG: 50S ribosomal protein L17 [Candidatus Pacebacteria bacterium]|nr:50S ribosomal protein L17 [Candidatus Paceibacterota bacterium]